MNSTPIKPDNRRNFVRIDFPIPLKSQLIRHSSPPLPITLINLSATGVAILCPEELNVGEVVKIVIPLKIINNDIFEMGAVPVNKYSKQATGTRYGLSFITTPSERGMPFITEEKKTQITRYINQYLIEQRKKGVG
ncbi:MAG: PilZ domain-containing protein [Deltaproteobacteria bacterium]|nr:MAG: PilZ domain-containing protein [Deltaproteobacteria bacterium]